MLAYIPMASMAALLLMVAWNMSEAKHFIRTLKIAPRDDILTLVTCFLLTVLFDMTIAVGVGMGLAAMLFIHRSIRLTENTKVESERMNELALPTRYRSTTSMAHFFFGSARRP